MKEYIGTGEIVGRQGSATYLFRTPADKEYLYYSMSYYEPGSVLYGASSLAPASGGYAFFAPLNQSDMKAKRVSFGADERQFDGGKWLYMKGLEGMLYEKRTVVVGINPSSFWLSLRATLKKQVYKVFSDRTAGLTMGMLVGDRSGLSKEEYSAFVSSGLVHIIAVSGGNIALIVSFIGIILFFVPYYMRLMIIAFSVLIYAIICGTDSSIIRATIMALLGIIALFWGRTVSIWRTMAVAFVSMLLRNPYYLLYDIGFVFSFAALMGLAFFGSSRKTQHTKKYTVRSLIARCRNEYLLPTIAASIGIFTPLLFFTSRVNLLSIVSNILIVPIVPIVMIYGFLSTLMYSVLGWHRIAFPQERGVSRIYLVNQRTVNNSIIVEGVTGGTRITLLLLFLTIIIIVVTVKQKNTHK